MQDFPTGHALADTTPAERPATSDHQGHFIELTLVDAARDADALYAATHGDDADPGQWTYMGYGPFADAGAMATWMRTLETSTDPQFMVVRDVQGKTPRGVVSFMNIVPNNRSIELGNIWYTPAARRSHTNTETIYLMLVECFERCRYRRVEWKCDSLNARSKAAATRLGFSYEGIFHQHIIYKGRNRDTAWFAMMDEDWPAIKENFEAVLYGKGGRLGALNAPLVRAVAPW